MDTPNKLPLEAKKGEVPPQSTEDNPTLKSALNKITNFIGKSLIATSLLVSCGDITETSTVQYQDNITTIKNADTWQNREVHLWSNGKDWHFEGKFPRSFLLEVYVDGKPVFNQEVDVENGAFDVSGEAGEAANNIDIMAYEINPDDDDESFVSIPIVPKITSEGMIGVPKVHGLEEM